MTTETRRPTASLLAAALAFSATFAIAQEDEAPTLPAIAYSDGSFRQGGHRLALDDRGTFHMLVGDSPIIGGITLAGTYEGRPWKADEHSRVLISRSEQELRLEAEHPAGGLTYTLTLTPDETGFVLRAERSGELPEADSEDVVRISLPASLYRDNQFYTERITLPYLDQTFEDPMLIDGFHEFRAHTTDDTLNFTVTTESLMRISDPWQERSPLYRLEIPFGEGDGASIEARLTVPPSAGNALDPAIRYSVIGYRTDARKRAVLEWPEGTERPDDEVKVVGVDGTVAFEGSFGDTVTFLGKNYAEFDFTFVQDRGVYRFTWSGGESDFFVIRENILADSIWTPTLDRFLPWQMSHAEVDFGASLPPKRKAFMDDGVRAPAELERLAGFISHGQEGSLYQAEDAIPSNIGGWFDGGLPHQSTQSHAYSVWMLALAVERFEIDRDTASYNQLEQKYTTVAGDGVPDILTQLEWGVWWLLQMQEPTGRVYAGVASRDERQAAISIPERITDGEPGTDDERFVFVDYHPHVQLSQVIALSVASRHLTETNRALSRRSIDTAREAFEYFAAQPELYRPTINFPHQGDDAAVVAGRHGMVAAAAAELYIATKDEKYLGLLEAMKQHIRELGVDSPAPRWSSDSGFWYAAPSLARLYAELPDGDLRFAVDQYLQRATEAKKMQLRQSPWPFAEDDITSEGVNGVALALIFDAYWLSQVKPELISVEDALPALEWVAGLHPLNNKTFVTGVGYDAPAYLFNSNIHGRVRNFRAVVPGAVMPGVSRISGNSFLAYADLPMMPQYHNARTADQTAWIFAVHALRSAGF